MAINEIAWSVYALSDPRAGDVRYIGWTQNVAARLAAHIAQSRHEQTHKAHWVASLTGKGLTPQCVVIECGSGSGWADAERRWIAHYREIGARLTNGTDGGDGVPGHRHSPETRRRLSIANSGKTISEETRLRLIAAHTGRICSDETRRKISEKNRHMSAEARHRISEAMHRRHVSDETRRRISEGKRNPGPETREKMAAAKRGKRASEETRRKMSESQSRAMTPEHRAQLSAANKLRWSRVRNG